MRIQRVRYAYRKLRSWYVSPVLAAISAVRYGLTGDSGKLSTHGGWRISRLRMARPDDDDQD